MEVQTEDLHPKDNFNPGCYISPLGAKLKTGPRSDPVLAVSFLMADFSSFLFRHRTFDFEVCDKCRDTEKDGKHELVKNDKVAAMRLRSRRPFSCARRCPSSQLTGRWTRKE
jgi:hypothetical protein